MKALRFGAVLGVGSVVFAVACSSANAGSSCGDYFDKLTVFDEHCAGKPAGLYAAPREAVVAFCDELGAAPGVRDFSAQLDACTRVLDPSTCTEPICPVRGTLAPGAPCANGAQCESGYCNFTGAAEPTTTELACGVCTVLALEGGDCGNASCDVGLHCDTVVTMTCQPFVPLHGSCTNDNAKACEPQYACIDSVCSERLGVGAPCPSGMECQLSLECDPETHTCETIPIASAGEACGWVNGAEVDCSSGLVCANGTCAAPRQQGATCTVGFKECALNLLCIGGTCQVPDFSTCK